MCVFFSKGPFWKWKPSYVSTFLISRIFGLFKCTREATTSAFLLFGVSHSLIQMAAACVETDRPYT